MDRGSETQLQVVDNLNYLFSGLSVRLVLPCISSSLSKKQQRVSAHLTRNADTGVWLCREELFPYMSIGKTFTVIIDSCSCFIVNRKRALIIYEYLL